MRKDLFTLDVNEEESLNRQITGHANLSMEMETLGKMNGEYKGT